MTEHYAIGYIPPLGNGLNPFLDLEEEKIVGAEVIGAGARDIFKRRFGEDYLKGFEAISEKTLIMLLEYHHIQRVILFSESVVDGIKSDAHVKWVRELEGQKLEVMLHYGRPVGIKI